VAIRATIEGSDKFGTSQSGAKYRVRIFENIGLDYNARVIDDGGTMEALECVETELSRLSDSAVVLNPTLKPALPFFTISYSPDTDDISSPMIPSKCELFLIREIGDTILQKLLNDMILHQNDDFFLAIDQDTGGGYEPFWKGIILQDQIEEIEASLPYEVKITATDGLKFLETQDANFTNKDLNPEPKSTSLLRIVQDCLDLMPHVGLYNATDTFLTTDVQFWENSQTYSTTGEPLKTLHLDVENLKQVDEGKQIEETTYVSAYETIKQIATAFLCRVYQSNGAYHFENITNKENASIKQLDYAVTRALLSSSIVNVSKTISNNVRGSYVGRDNLKLKLPALKQVLISQTTNNQNLENTFRLDSSNTPRTIDLGIFDTDEKLFVNLEYKGDFDIALTGTNDVTAFHEVTLQIKATPLSGSIKYYDGTVWQTSVQTITVVSSSTLLKNDGSGRQIKFAQIKGTKAVELPALDDASRIEILATYDGLKGERVFQGSVNKQNLSGFADVGSFNDDTFILINFEGSTVDDQDIVETMASDNVDTQIKDKEIFDYGELIIGDGGFHTGRIIVRLTSSKETADTFSYRGGSENTRLFKLITQKRLALQAKPLEIYDGTLGYIEGYFKTITKGTDRLVPMDVTFNAFDANFQGRWFVVSSDVTNVSIRDIDRKPAKFPSDIIRGWDSGFVSGKMVIQGDDNGGGQLGGGLYYDGVEFTQYARESFFLKKAFVATINTLTYTATGQSQDITEDMHLVHIDTGGENFDVDATLPASADVQGQEFIIITDKDNHNGSRITLVPQAGDTIDNDTDYDLQHASDKVVLRVIGTNYYVE
jgi:hypothetical protein